MASPSRITPDRAVLVGALLAALVYIQDVRYDFILDDVSLILLNESITSWRNWKSAFLTHIFAATGPAVPLEIVSLHYRPVYKLWQMLNDQLFGPILPWWHLTSLLLHVAVTFLVYQVGIKLLKERWTAALAALLFAFHPIHVESVAYVTASTDLLVTLFALLSFLAYFRFREEQPASPLYFVAALILAAFATMSKETAVMFPWLLVAYEALREPPAGTTQSWKRFAWTLPFFGVVGAYLAVRTMLFGLNAGPGPGGSRILAFVYIPLVLASYLRNVFWPVHLSFFYPAEWVSQWTVPRGLALVLVTAAVVFAWNRYRERSGVRLQLLWAAILFAPALLGVFAWGREDWVHDRHMYWATVPVCLIAAVFLTDSRWPTKVSVIASAVVLMVLLVDTGVQVPRFSDDVALYTSALKVAPRSFIANSYLADTLWTYGRHEEALREFKITTELAPRFSATHERYGAALAEIGRNDEARDEYIKALQWSPRPTEFRAFLLAELADTELKRSEFPEAAGHLSEAVQISPQALNYHSLLAVALTHEGRSKEADEAMRAELGIRQRFVQDQHNRSN
jgi:protein O-mannosyl-transferase